MTKILIDDENAGRIADYLADVNGRATARTITSIAGLRAAMRAGDERIAHSELPKAFAKGWRVSYTPAGPAARSYSGAVATTRVVIERDAKGFWKLISAARATVYGGSAERIEHYATAEQQREIARRAINDLRTLRAQNKAARTAASGEVAAAA